jgi:hypothetical protein
MTCAVGLDGDENKPRGQQCFARLVQALERKSFYMFVLLYQECSNAQLLSWIFVLRCGLLRLSYNRTSRGLFLTSIKTEIRFYEEIVVFSATSSSRVNNRISKQTSTTTASNRLFISYALLNRKLDKNIEHESLW